MQKVDLPDMEKGDWKVSHRTVDHLDFSIISSGRQHPKLGETFTLLTRGRTLVMSDTPAEQDDHWAPVHYATGNCLINGLGIGMVLKNVLAKPEVTSVIVVEISQDLIDLIAPHYQDPRLTIARASAFDYTPPKDTRFQMVWHDIWDTICADNLKEMGQLHRKYGRKADWQGSWCKGWCQRLQRQESRGGW